MRRLASAMLGRRLAIAESCTGGLVADRITDVPGASGYLDLCVVAYSNGSKVGLLGVDPDELERHGAVSERVAIAMAEGVRGLTGADVGVATTGIAGPGGATGTKPVGLVHFAVSTDDGVTTDHRVFPGDRREVKIAATEHAIDMVINAVSVI